MRIATHPFRCFHIIPAFFICAAVILSAWTALHGGTTGKITGVVTDSQNKEPIVNANIVVKGTNLGSATDFDGVYTILNVPPGIYSVEISCINFHTKMVRDVGVYSDLTTPLNVKLDPAAIINPEVEVIAKRNPIQADKTHGGATIDKGKLEKIRPADMTELTKTIPGFKVGPEGKVHYRGSRSGDVAFIQEGVDLRDPLVDTQLNLNLSAESVDEISVMSGGYNAEYGRAMGAIVQITTAEGKRDRYSGRFNYQTDRVIETYSCSSDRMEAAMGGPVPYTRNWKNPVTFYFTAIGNLTNTYTPFDINRPANNYLGLGIKLPERQNNDYQGSLKLAYNLTESKKLTLYLTSAYSQWDIYPNGEGGISGNYGYNYKYNLDNRPWAWNRRFSGTLTFTNNISSKTYYEIKLITFRTRSKVQPRGKSPGEFTLQDDIENSYALASDRNGNGKLDKDEYLDTDGDGFMDGFWDANDNNIFDGGGEGYEDLNMNGRWDRGEDWVDLNGNGIYDAAEPWIDVVNPLTGENNLGVFDSWDSYTDLNGNGQWDPAEPQLAEHDWNRNGVWDGERFIDADNDGQYDAWETWTDLNGNYLWDPGEPYVDTNGNGKFDYSEGYDDKNKNGRIDKRDLAARGQSTPFVDAAEPYLDGDFWWDTGEPFIDEPDPITGEFNGAWDPGEIWFDLPSSSNQQTGAGLYYMGADPVLNGRYDGPNYMVDEYELFCQPANWSFSSDRSRPVIYLFDEEARGADWPDLLLAYIPGKSTWINRTLHDTQNPEFNIRNYNVEEDKEWFLDYNNNGQWDPADGFLNPGMWDPTAFWQDRVSTEYTLKFDIASQGTKHHQLKSGCEIKFRDLEMQSVQRPDLEYTGEATLPAGSPWPDRGGIRDFYHYKPWEGAVYVQDKMEFEGLIVNAGLRDDFIIHDPSAVNEFRERVESDEPGAIYANRGTQRISPRLGISHPITEKSKLYFNYGHFYQAPSFQYFYKSSTANFDANTTIGNPNLEYEKTIQYELGVNTQISDYVILNIAGYYKDQYDMISTQDERWKNLTLDRYANIDYGRMRGFEFTIDKRPANHYALTFNYDFSFAYGKASDQHAAQDARLKNVPYNYDEHPLDWDETHKINAYLTILYDKNDYPRLLGMTLPDDWSLTLQWEFGSGVPYTPSIYTTGISNSNLILPNSARYPWHENTTLKFEKYYMLNPQTGSRFFIGLEVDNLFNKRNTIGIYGETGSPTKATHPLNPAYVPNNNRQEYEANPRNFSSPRNIKFTAGLTI